MGFIIKKLIKTIVKKASSIDATDVMSQVNTGDIIDILKDIIL